MRVRQLCALLLMCWLGSMTIGPAGVEWPRAMASSKKKKKTKYVRVRHTVAPGETLGEIAAEYGVKVKHLMKWNKLKNAHSIRVGQTLSMYIPKGQASGGGRSRGSNVKEYYEVKKGDNLGSVAKKLGVSTRKLKKWNRSIRKPPHTLRIGQKLRYYKWVGSDGRNSQSRGHAFRGRLLNGEPLKSGAGYKVRSPGRAYGTDQTVSLIRKVCRKYTRKFRGAPKVVIGDISFKRGGYMRPHKSHQSGRDVDMGYVHKGNRQLDNFESMNKHNLDVAKTWYLVKSFVDTGEVEYMFIDHGIQRLLYEYAVSHGVSKTWLEANMQYPRGRGATKAPIRHARGHRNHMHIRFRCPKDDKACR